MAIDPQNLSGTATLTFNDDFNTLNLRNGGSGTWSTNYWWGQPNGVTLAGNGEQEWYVDANFAGTQSVKPWTVNNGVLDITAQNASPEIQQQINGYQYTSGMLTTHDSFSQTYGYFEMKAELPQGAGLWPAFWLLPENGAWPPEIDVMEQLGNNPNTYYTTAHTQQTGSHTSQGSAISTPDLTTGYHTYGVDWEADKLTYYFDGKQAWQTDTPADMHDPMYMLVNLAVGGYWPGNPTPDPNFSETMHVDYVRAYSAKPAGDVTPATGDAAAGATTPAPTTDMTATSTQASATTDASVHTDTAPGATSDVTSTAPATHLSADAAPVSAPVSDIAAAASPPTNAQMSATVDPAVHIDTTPSATSDVTSTPASHLSADAAPMSAPASDIATVTAADAGTTPAPASAFASASTSVSEAAPGAVTQAAPVEAVASSSTTSDAFNFAALAPEVKPATTTAATTQQSIDLQSAVDAAASAHKGHGHHDGAGGHGAHHATSDFAGLSNHGAHDHDHHHAHAHAAAHHHWSV